MAHKKFKLSRDKCYKLYVIQQKNIPEISIITGYSTSTLSYKFKQYGIQTRTHSDSLEITNLKKTKQEWIIDGDIAYLYKQGQKIIVDASCIELAKQHTWYINVCGYVRNSIKKKNGIHQKSISLHRLLLNTTQDKLTDHINGNKLDNRLSNLREATPKQNCINRGLSYRNKTGIKGVRYLKRTGKYGADFYLNGKCIRLGSYNTLEEATQARKMKEIEIYGDYSIWVCRKQDKV
jgi:hypothetical protein